MKKSRSAKTAPTTAKKAAKKTSRPKPAASTPTAAQRRRALALLAALEKHYPDAVCELHYKTPHELLISTILSAQATDAGVNKATPELFKRFPTPADYTRVTPADIEPYIKTIGLFRNKAKAVHAAMTAIVEHFGGEVPRTMDELLTLRGVARKTANVVLGNAFQVNVGFVVDTHIQRLAARFGLTSPTDNVAAIEKKLMALFPQDRWCDLSHMIIWHGRRACQARRSGGACNMDHEVCRDFGTNCDLKR